MGEERVRDERGANHSGEVIKFVILGTVVAFILAFLMHYIGSSFGGMYVLEGVLPINESVWEHMKLGFYPSIFVTLVPWCSYVKQIAFKRRWVMAAIGAAISSIVIWAGYYGLKHGFYVEGMVVDFLLLAVGLLFGFVHAAMISDDGIYEWVKWLCIIYIVLMAVIYYIFAFAPLNLPVFVPPVQG